MSPPEFKLGATVIIDAPRSVGGELAKLKGERGLVKSSTATAEGRVYTLLVQSNDAADINGKSVEVDAKWLKKAGAVAQSANVQHLPVDTILKSCSVYCIPVFQRRYCWTEGQWRKLWKNVESVRDNPELNNHSLQRLMLLQRRDRSRLVLDGQQRLTTLTLLISALHDRLKALGDDDTSAELASFLTEGRFVPTMDDRPDFRRCLAEVAPTGSSDLVRAKRTFAELCGRLGEVEAAATADAVLRRLSMTTFVLENPDSIQGVFESMARKQEMIAQATANCDLFSCAECFVEGEGGKETPSTHWGPDGDRLCAAHAAARPGSEPMTPGVPMSPVDLIRNFVIDHYATEGEQRRAHADYWSPIEAAFGESTGRVDAGLRAFLRGRGFDAERQWDLYGAFLNWWAAGARQQTVTTALADARLAELLAVASGAAVVPPAPAPAAKREARSAARTKKCIVQ